MSLINPIGKLYDDMVRILQTMTIKYSYRGDNLETLESRENADKYKAAYMSKDNFFTYDDYSRDEFFDVNPFLTDNQIYSYMNDLDTVPIALQEALLKNRREYILNNYEEQNDYYRMLNGLPNLGDKYALYKVSDYAPELCEKHHIPSDMYIHEVEDKLGRYYIDMLDANGVVDKIIESAGDDPYSEYLHHIGQKRIPIFKARVAKNFEILYLDPRDIMESTYTEFISVYNQCRNYFMSTAYVYDYRNIVERYDNFIGLCIFVMAMQQLSIRCIPNAIDREFYDSRAIQLLYETYGLPFNSRIDDLTQKQIVQNMNILIQNKASDKVILDIGSILGFTNLELYEYYLMKKRMFDTDGRPIFKKKNVFDINSGKYVEVYDYESMFDVYFQKVSIGKQDVREELMEPLNRVNYRDVIYYDPYWWEDDDLNKEVWQNEYNAIETKYIGLTMPYRLTEMVFESVYQLRMITDKSEELTDFGINLPKITEKVVPLPDVVMLLCALMAKKFHIRGEIYSMPSQLVHVLEVLDQEVYKEDGYTEVLGFDFDMFKLDPEEEVYQDVRSGEYWRKLDDGKWHLFNPSLEHQGCKPKTDDEIAEEVDHDHFQKKILSRIQRTALMLENYLKERKYIVLNGHDVDVDRNSGYQLSSSPTHLVDFDVDTSEWVEFMGYINTLSTETLGTSPTEKKAALNAIFKDMKKLYHFLSYRLSVTQDLKEYYAIRKFYDVAFYTREIPKVFKIPTDAEGTVSYTYLDYLKDNNLELYNFVHDLEVDKVYLYMEHIIYCMENVLDEVGYLYFLNDEISPLQELLIQLVDFFRSFTTDLIDFSSVMVVDWRMENMIKLIDHPQYMHKVDAMKDDLFGAEYGDFLSKFQVNFPLSDPLYLKDYITISGKEYLLDKMEYHDEVEKICAKETLRDEMPFYDLHHSSSGNIEVDDNIRLKDTCFIIRNEP